MSGQKIKKTETENYHPPLTAQIESTILSNDEHDPVAMQYVPSSQENIIDLKENADPIGDFSHSPVKGIVHRHQDRVLLKITDTCAAYCRFCFRKEMVGKGQGVLSDHEINHALDYISNDKNIREVIFTGGDPLTLSNRRLQDIMDKLNTMAHLDIIRFHTRVPIMKPTRVDDEFITIINQSPKAIYMVVHVNHAQEINQPIKDVFAKLSKSAAQLLSQSVLLKGINDDAKILEDLFRTLVANRVKPYYLHHPDLASGTGHFRISIKKGQALMKTLRKNLSGLCMPTYVLDIPGGYGKVLIEKCYIQDVQNNIYDITDLNGTVHQYKDNQTIDN